MRADEKKRQTHFAKPHVRPQTNALKSTNIAIEQEAPQQSAEKLPSKILLMNLSYHLMCRRRGPGRLQGARMAHEAS